MKLLQPLEVGGAKADRFRWRRGPRRSPASCSDKSA